MREDGKVLLMLSSSEFYQGVRGQRQVSSWNLPEDGHICASVAHGK